MTELVDGMRVETTQECGMWICHMKQQEELADILWHESDRTRNMGYFMREAAKRLSFTKNLCIPPGEMATVRRVTYYNEKVDRPLPAWLEFHRSNPNFDKWKDAFYNREGKYMVKLVGYYDTEEQPLRDERYARSFGMWVLEFDNYYSDLKGEYVCGFGHDNKLPIWLRAIEEENNG